MIIMANSLRKHSVRARYDNLPEEIYVLIHYSPILVLSQVNSKWKQDEGNGGVEGHPETEGQYSGTEKSVRAGGCCRPGCCR